MKKWLIGILLVVNIVNLGMQYVTLNVNTVFKVTCDDKITFRYETGFGSGCSTSYRSMVTCFQSWKKDNSTGTCELLRTERINLFYVHKWLEYSVVPKWHHAYASDSNEQAEVNE